MNPSNKFFQALSLPTICNMNPRSVYNKVQEFHTFVEEEEVDLIFMSESWEREYLTLDQIIKLEDHVVISNVSKISGKGGRPAIIANNKKFEVQNIFNKHFNSNPMGGRSCLVYIDTKKCHTEQ